MTVFIASFLFVVLAEMGDKTQLLAMAFATRFPAKTVLAGVLVATLLNHLLAVVLGSWLTNLVPLDVIQIAASASFILFGLWTLRGDKLEGEDKKYRFSPFWTVAVAFFFAEMGDKTQLATVALAAKYQSIVPIWLGTTAGMMVADAFGIIVGVLMGKKRDGGYRVLGADALASLREHSSLTAHWWELNFFGFKETEFIFDAKVCREL